MQDSTNRKQGRVGAFRLGLFHCLAFGAPLNPGHLDGNNEKRPA